MIRHARGQRNLTPEWESYLRGMQYNLEKKEVSAGRPKKGGQNVPQTHMEQNRRIKMILRSTLLADSLIGT